MEFYELIKKRRSTRGFEPREIPAEVLNRVLDAARVAPSACNLQPWHFLVLKEKAAREKLKEAYSRDWFWSAPVIIVGCVDMEKAWRRGEVSYGEVDLAIAMDHLILAAVNEGLGTCWVGAFDEAKARAVLQIPENMKIVAMTPLGYPMKVNGTDKRKPLEEIVHYEKW
jgi:nitroreductase